MIKKMIKMNAYISRGFLIRFFSTNYKINQLKILKSENRETKEVTPHSAKVNLLGTKKKMERISTLKLSSLQEM